MSVSSSRQPTLKPQDLLVALKIAVNSERNFTYTDLANELFMSTSEVHSSVKRAQVCGLLARASEHTAIKFALQEFLTHGIQYVLPPVSGMLTRGIPTALAGPPLSDYFASSDGLPLVWPTPDGQTQGIGLLPIYPSIPAASSVDFKLYSVLTLVDALRSGKAREREIASQLIMEFLR
jgi:hypothetical protein